MPRAAKHCGYPGCTTLVRGATYCAQHIGWKTSARTASRDVLDRPEWKQLRPFILKRDQHLCQIRTPGICTGRATVVDKKIPASARPDLALDPENLQAACQPCNDHKARTFDRAPFGTTSDGGAGPRPLGSQERR
ncbi:HNH endonuclease [Mycobacteroides abscessus]|uniref:HNH endonuclease n=1 Tax=Mycobacteroides abscessus TaxID=36809 RepID=UPI00092BF0C5|nr:HNH endonuclease [Mycobacteroides abscessus]MDO3201212.1 HNH endonuclease [Mycobacteroides abscessus subsp. abscessus]SHY28725.1 HNH endonuclease [Mycobacteroides abscessus subsp. abscessus]SHY45072.1 HNH endonuclease [Mycobacteroides abscessus subsp. abscessus]